MFDLYSVSDTHGWTDSRFSFTKPEVYQLSKDLTSQEKRDENFRLDLDVGENGPGNPHFPIKRGPTCSRFVRFYKFPGKPHAILRLAAGSTNGKRQFSVFLTSEGDISAFLPII